MIKVNRKGVLELKRDDVSDLRAKRNLSMLSPDLFGGVISPEAVGEGLRVEQECRNRAAMVCAGIQSIGACLRRIGEFAKSITETWKTIKDTPEIRNGRLDAAPVAEFAARARAVAESAAPAFAVNTGAFLAPYDHNILDMTALKRIVDLDYRADGIAAKISATETDRRKPLFRELHRTYSAIVSCSVSIMNGRYASENVPKWYSEAVFHFVESVVGKAKKGMKALKPLV